MPQELAAPQRAQGPEGMGLDLGAGAPTAKTLRVRAVCLEPHLGQAGRASEDMERANCSNWFLHDLQAYS